MEIGFGPLQKCKVATQRSSADMAWHGIAWLPTSPEDGTVHVMIFLDFPRCPDAGTRFLHVLLRLQGFVRTGYGQLDSVEHAGRPLWRCGEDGSFSNGLDI